LVLDEPAGGLDPAVRRQLIDLLIEQAAARPMTIVLSSHILSDVERLVDRVAFMKDGRVVGEGDLEALRARVKRL
jgi:ABC-2 type transport system ATP-binding protein